MEVAAQIIVSDSEMGKLIRNYDWEDNPLGPISSWPPSLVTSVNFLLQSPVPLVMLWGEHGIMLYNDAYMEIAGKRHPTLLGSKVTEGWPEVADFNRNVLDKGLSGKTLEYKDQHLVLDRNNVPEEVWMDLTYSPIIDESGRPGGVMAIVLETTTRIRAEQRQQAAEISLRRERERLHSMFMQAPAMIAILNGPNHVFELANPQYMKLVGERPIIGMPVSEALPEVSDQGFFDILDTVYKTGEPYYGNESQVKIEDKNGALQDSFLNFVYQPSFDINHKVDGILVHAVDVTDQVVARRKAEEIANLNTTITDNATTGLLIMDADHNCTFMNPAAEKITGYTFEELTSQNKPLHDIVHYKKLDGSPYPIHECPTAKALKRKARIQHDDHFVHRDGKMYPVSITSSPIIQDGKIIGIVEEIRDISKEKRAERKIRQLNKDLENRVEDQTRELTAANKELGRSNEELQDFAYVASHDLQEPLRKIAAFSNLLQQDYGKQLPPDAHTYIAGLQKSSARMRTLISDLLTYSRVTTQAQPFQTISLRKVVTDMLEDMQARIDETKATIIIGKLGKVQADPLQLRLLLQNLVSNAVKYAKPGIPPKVKIYAECDKEVCSVYIEDNGIGFEEQYLDRIFTIFQRLHGRNEYEGTGVGLAISKKIVDRHGGTITARSKPGEGTTFIVTLPVTQETTS